MEIYEVATGDLIEEIEAHDSEIWSIALLPDKKSIVSGGADKQLKFWDFQLKKSDDKAKQKSLTLGLSKKITMEDGILSLVSSSKFLAVALLDSTVKVFHSDTMNFFLSLYGHKVSFPLFHFFSPLSPFLLFYYPAPFLSSFLSSLHLSLSFLSPSCFYFPFLYIYPSLFSLLLRMG